MPGWHSRHSGWGHTGQEDPEAQAGLQSRGFLALPGLQLVQGFRLYHNHEYQLDLRVGTWDSLRPQKAAHYHQKL